MQFLFIFRLISRCDRSHFDPGWAQPLSQFSVLSCGQTFTKKLFCRLHHKISTCLKKKKRPLICLVVIFVVVNEFSHFVECEANSHVFSLWRGVKTSLWRKVSAINRFTAAAQDALKYDLMLAIRAADERVVCWFRELCSARERTDVCFCGPLSKSVFSQ